MSVVQVDGESTFSVEVNGKDYEDEAPMSFELFLVAELAEYVAYVPSVSFRFTVLAQNPCRIAKLSSFVEIEPIVAQAGEPKYTFSFDVLTDSISDEY